MSANRFPLKKLTLAIATAMLSGPGTSSLVHAETTQLLAPDQQWQCASENGSWSCKKVARQVGPLMDAKRPKALTTATTAAVATVPVVAEKKQPVASQQAKATPKPTPGQEEVPVAASAKSSPSALKAITTLDWVPRAELTPAQEKTIAPFMSGTYIEPNRPGIDYQGDPNQAPIRASADHSKYYDNKKIAVLEGKASIRQGYRQVQSDTAKLNQQTSNADFKGHVVYREPGLLLVGKEAKVNTETGRVEVDDAEYVTHQMKLRGEATTLLRQPDEVMVLDDATYTSAPPGSNTWKLKGKTVELDPNTGRGEATNATLELGNIPVFYFPYINFPIDKRRKSGFLYPTFSVDSDNGFDYSQPYYFNLAPNYDATLTPRIMTDRGLLLEGEYRHLSKNSHTEVGGAFMNSDQLKDENRNYDENRWFFSGQHFQQITPHWTAQIDYANASDKDYLRDFGTDLYTNSESVLNQQFITRYQGGDLDNQWQFSLNAQNFKNMELDRDDPYNRLPQLVFNGQSQLNDQWQVDYLADYTYFSRDDDWKYLGVEPKTGFDKEYDVNRYIYGRSHDNELSNADGSRVYLQSGVHYNFERSYGYIRPALKIRSVQYNLSGMDRSKFGMGSAEGTTNRGLKYDTSPGTTVPSLSIDAGLNFERSVNWASTHFTQTLEPRILYVYAPYESGQNQNPLFDTSEPAFSYGSLWRDNRFTGYDRLPDANQLTLGVETRLLEDDGFERLRAGIGQILYFRDRRVLADPYYGSEVGDKDNDANIGEGRRRYLEDHEASTSPLASNLVYRLNDEWTWTNEWIYNTNQGRNDRFTTMATWSPDAQRVINFGYNYTNQVERTVKDEDGNAAYDPVTKQPLYADGSINQTDMSILWPVTNTWSAIGRWNYDLTNSRNLELMFGGEKESDSYTMRVVWRTYVDAEDDIDNAKTKSGIFLQFVLKGLGSIAGSKVQSYLQEINGYERREEQKASYYK